MIVTASPSPTLQKRWQQALRGSCPVHEVADQIELRQSLGKYKPDVLLLDCDVTHHRGLRQVRNLLQASLHTRIIFFTEQVNDHEAIAVLKAGASGYCSKTFTVASLIKAVDAVRKGEVWAERRVISLLIRTTFSSHHCREEVCTKYSKPDQFTSPDTILLSPRERDVAAMIATGDQNKTISNHLSISEKTVKAHLTNIFKKLGLSSRTQLALFVRHNEFSLTDAVSIQNPA